MESSIDFYSSEIQNDLELLVKNLLQFKPDAVAVEAAVNAQISVDESYQKFELADLRDRNKMKNETLGEIHMFGETYPITYNNESIQIGYRLGKLLGLNKVYAIDDDTILDMGVMRQPTQLLTDACDVLRVDMNKHAKDSVIN